jgi:hypothetical protein
MQCPRCGLQNSPGATSCARCALPLAAGEAPTEELPPAAAMAPAQAYPPGWAPLPSHAQPVTYAPEMPAGPTRMMPVVTTRPSPARAAESSLVRKLKPFVLTIGALAGLLYAGWAGTARRSAFTDAADRSLDELRSSDRLDSVLLVVCTLLVVLGVGWMFVGWERAVSTLRVAALACLGVAVVAAAVAGYLLGTWEGDPDTASHGYVTLAAAFALAAVALVLELVASRPTSKRG